MYKGGPENSIVQYLEIQLLKEMQWLSFFLSVVSLLGPAPSFSSAEVSYFPSVKEKEFSDKVQRRREAVQCPADDACPYDPSDRFDTACDGKPCSYCQKTGTNLSYLFEGSCETIAGSICQCRKIRKITRFSSVDCKPEPNPSIAPTTEPTPNPSIAPTTEPTPNPSIAPTTHQPSSNG